MFVSIFGKFDTPHEVEMVKGELVSQGILAEDIALLRDEIAILIHVEKELEDEVVSTLRSHGAQELSVRDQPRLDRSFETETVWQERLNPMPARDKNKMPHAGPLENPNQDNRR